MSTTEGLQNSVCMITGATSGIGQATAFKLAEMGAELFLVCRDQLKAELTAQSIVENTGNSRITLLIGDLSSQADIRRITLEFLSTQKPLTILINNAGVFNFNHKTTVEGIEEMFAVNHLAPFLLTNLLLPAMRPGSSARIINVASGAHSLVKGINFHDLNFNTGFKALKVYSHSKLANVLFSLELAKRLEGSSITVNTVDPGEVSTGLGAQNGWIGKIFQLLMKPFLQTSEKGARTSVFVSTSLELDGLSGKYFRNCREKKPKPWAIDEDAAKKLWKASEELTNINQ